MVLVFVVRASAWAKERAMKTAEDIESYLIKLGATYEQAKPGIWVIKPNNSETIAVSIAGPVVAFRMKVMDTPAGNREKLFQRLLELNTTELVHGAFGLEDGSIVMVHALALENLDYNEFSAVVDDMNLAVAKLYPDLSKFR